MKRSKIPSYAGILVGIAAIITAIVMLASGPADRLSGMSTGSYTSHSWYGGDAYTGIQQAAADTANNVSAQSDIIKAGFRLIAGRMPSAGALLLFFGLAMVCWFARSLNEIDVKNAFEEAVLDKLDARPAEPVPTAVLASLFRDAAEHAARQEAAADEPAEEGPDEAELSEDEYAEGEPAEEELSEDEYAEDEPADAELAVEEPAEFEAAAEEPAEAEHVGLEPVEDEPVEEAEPDEDPAGNE